jgi:hypothetical protein
MSAESTDRVTRNRVVQRWGTPQVTLGSVNEPREREEQGVRFNEKWVYLSPSDPSRPRQRTIYWHRYDFVASRVTDASGNEHAEDLASLVAQLDDRLYLPPSNV